MRGRFVKEQHLRLQRPGTNQGKALLLAARQHPRGAVGHMGQAALLQRFGHYVLAAAARHAA